MGIVGDFDRVAVTLLRSRYCVSGKSQKRITLNLYHCVERAHLSLTLKSDAQDRAA